MQTGIGEERKQYDMKQIRKYISVCCMAAVMLLCSVNFTYAWQNLGQTALNINMGGSASDAEKPNPPDDDKPKPPDDNKPKPPADSKPQKPGASDEKDETPSGTQKPSGNQPGSSTGTQNGKNDAKTGDTAEYLKYLALMLGSFAVMIVVGVMLIILLINEIEKRRK